MARQLSKALVVKYIELVMYHQLPERMQVQEVMCDLSNDLSLSNTTSHRVRIIDFLIALSY